MKKTVLRAIGIVLVMVICFSIFPTDVFAWKNLTHVNSADLILLEITRSMLMNNGRATVTINVPYENGQAYTYEIPKEYQDALSSYPSAFRAGSMGPDFYPDILTGQGYIHPYDSTKNISSGEWITLLCDSVNMMPQNSEKRKEALAFTLGFMLHFCGDMFGHDFINCFAGGAYPALTDVNYLDGTDQNLNIILSHMSEETYMDSLVNWDFYHNAGSLSIAAPIRFVADTLVFDGNVNNGAAKIFLKYGSVPAQYEYLVNLRMKLYNKAEAWRPSIDPTYTTAVKFLDAWVEDLDNAAYALVGCFDNMANRMVTEKNPSTTGIVTEELSDWVDNYGKYITPVPDIIVDGIHLPVNILELITSAIGLDEFVEDIKSWLMDQIKDLALTALGFTGLQDTIDEYSDRMSNPQVQLDHEDNPFMPDTDNFSEFKEYMDRYGSEQKLLDSMSLINILTGSDGGVLDKLLDSDLEAFYNTLVMFKLILMGPDNFTDFINRLSGVTQNVYLKNTANLVATSLEVKVKTSNSTNAGTDDNIYVVCAKKVGNGYQQLIKKLLDKSDYNDFEANDNDTYVVELGQAVRLDQLEVWVEQEGTGTAASGWDCASLSITPMHAGVQILDTIDFGGKSNMDSGKTWNLNFHDELISRTQKTTWTATTAVLRVKTKSNSYLGEDCGTYSHAYLDVIKNGSKVASPELDNPGTDFENGDDDTYYLSLANGNNRGVPLNQLNLKLRLAGNDAWKIQFMELTLYHGEIQLTDTIRYGSKTLENSSWDLNISKNISGKLRDYKPVSLSYETNVDDGLASYVNSLDDSTQWANRSSILWGNETVRSKVFFKIFKGFSPDIEYSGKEEISRNEAFDIDVTLEGMWNGVREGRRNRVIKIEKMPAVKGNVKVSFINSAGSEVCSTSGTVTNGILSVKGYSNGNLAPGVYDVRVTYTAATLDQKYSDAAETFKQALTVHEASKTYTVRFKVENGAWDDGSTEDKVVTLTGYESEVLKLSDGQIPAVGKKPNDTYKAGKWDTTPTAGVEITGDTTYKYTYAKKDTISQTVTFKVENGAWDDGSTEDIVVTLTGYENDVLKLSDGQIPTAGTKPDDTYKAGAWDTTPVAGVEITGDTTYKYTYAKKDTISQTVTFKVENGAWDDGSTEDKVVTLTGYENDVLKLSDGQIPTAGTKPDDTYKPGAWDTTPAAGVEITGNPTYKYTYAKKDTITQTVTFKVENGAWDDGSTEDKVVTLTGYENDTLTLSDGQIPTAGTKPDDTYKAGAWDTTPVAGVEITGNPTYKYTYAKKDTISQTVTFKVENGAWDDGSTEDKVVTLTGYENDTLTLSDGQIPTAGTKPDDTYKAGAWDTTPVAGVEITGNPTYKYTYAKKDTITQTVTFKVENGAWDDGSTEDIVVTLTGYENDTLTLSGGQIPAVGTKPADTYKAGAWDTTPVAGVEITGDTTYIYTYVMKDKYVVTFETDGGSQIAPVTVFSGESVAAPEDPEKRSFVFAGWFADEGLTAPYDFTAGVFSDTVIYAAWEQVTYKANGNAEYTDGSGKDVVVTVKRSHADETCFAHFTSVMIDGQTLDIGTDYTAAAGSTVITLKASALQELSGGDHTVTVVFDDGQAETVLTVKSVPITPPTGDVGIPAVLIMMIAAGAVLVLLYGKRHALAR